VSSHDDVSDVPLHVVLGCGQVGRAVAERLAGSGVSVRVVSRHHPANLADGVDWRHADLTDVEAAIDAVKGASVVYQCLNVPYTRWPELFPPLQRSVLAAAERAEAVLVTLENVYGYGPTGGRPLTEDLPLAATTSKGRTRAAMSAELFDAAQSGRVRLTIGRASDFFGAGVTESTVGLRTFVLHTYSYVPDIATALVTLGRDERALGQVWHLPGPETVTTRALVDLISDNVGYAVEVRTIPTIVVRALGFVSPMMRGLAEMAYQFEQPFVLDTSKYDATFNTPTTPLGTAISDTLAWYRTQRSTT
jgi:nucleoside-diphosphate-sugar epimerase